MNENDYPRLYKAADTASKGAQGLLLFLHKVQSLVLILAAASALISIQESWVALLSIALFLGSFFIDLYIRTANLQDTWYRTRALSESIKTSVWRLLMGAEPFAKQDTQENLQTFRSLLAELLKDNNVIGNKLGNSSGEQITKRMLIVLGQDYLSKKDLYLRHRIEDQMSWYDKKANYNKNQSRNIFYALIILYTLAITLLLLRVANPSWTNLPTDVIAVCASCLIGWRELKRHDELSSAYNLTAHEVGIVESKFKIVKNSSELAAFVSDAENVFSREHTQWAARRDH